MKKQKKEFISIINSVPESRSPLSANKTMPTSMSSDEFIYAVKDFYETEDIRKFSSPLFMLFVANPKDIIKKSYTLLAKVEANALVLCLLIACNNAEKQSKSFVKYIKYSKKLLLDVIKNNKK